MIAQLRTMAITGRNGNTSSALSDYSFFSLCCNTLNKCISSLNVSFDLGVYLQDKHVVQKMSLSSSVTFYRRIIFLPCHMLLIRRATNTHQTQEVNIIMKRVQCFYRCIMWNFRCHSCRWMNQLSLLCVLLCVCKPCLQTQSQDLIRCLISLAFYIWVLLRSPK